MMKDPIAFILLLLCFYSIVCSQAAVLSRFGKRQIDRQQATLSRFGKRPTKQTDDAGSQDSAAENAASESFGGNQRNFGLDRILRAQEIMPIEIPKYSDDPKSIALMWKSE